MTEPAPRHDLLMRQATHAAVATAITLVCIKLAAWAYTGSVALLSTLIDSLLDAGASLINLWAVHHALVPADREHRFGHGKAEPLAGLAQSAFVAGSGLFLVVEAVSRLSHPVVVQRPGLGMAVMAVSIALTMALVGFQKRVVARTRSVAISADSLHYTGDVLINGSVIVSLGAGEFLGWSGIDPVFALGIAAYLLFNAARIALGSLDMLMDRELPDHDRGRIRDIAISHPDVVAVHDLRTRQSGRHGFIQLHLEMDPDLPLHRAHAISDEVEQAIMGEFPGFEVIIHEDPAGLETEQAENTAV